MICKSLISLISFLGSFTIVLTIVLGTSAIIDSNLIKHSMLRLEHLICSFSSFWWCKTICIMAVYITWSVNILRSNLLIIHSNDISIISTYISLFIQLWSLHFIVVAIVGATCIFFRLMPGASTISNLAMRVMTMNSRKFLWCFIGSLILTSIHTKLLVHIIHVLRCSEILHNIAHISIVISASIWSSS